MRGRIIGGALLGGALLTLGTAGARAQDISAGRHVAAQICQSCHGLDGLATQPEVPNLAGDDLTYLNRQLAAFRSGARQNEQMSAVASMLDDKKAADVAAYYNAIQVQVTSVPGHTP